MDLSNSIYTPVHCNSSQLETHRILVVDDEPSLCFAYRKLFGGEKFHSDICENVESALELIKSHRYFAVISDVRFAGHGNEDGVHLVSAVRKEQPEAEVILVTGYGSDELKRTVHDLGAAHYYDKPVKPALLLSLLRTLHLAADERENALFTAGLQFDLPPVS